MLYTTLGSVPSGHRSSPDLSINVYICLLKYLPRKDLMTVHEGFKGSVQTLLNHWVLICLKIIMPNCIARLTELASTLQEYLKWCVLKKQRENANLTNPAIPEYFLFCH